MTASAGYSGTPLPKKLGLKDGQGVAFVGLPPEHAGLTEARAFRAVDLVEAVGDIVQDGLDLVHMFSKSAAVIRAALPVFRTRIRPDGAIWISWPKKASKVPTDVTEDVIRDAARSGGLVDVKVCAVDEIWSGLKLVIPRELRP